jgi:hypothetical protein
MRPEWEKNRDKATKSKLRKFKEWQNAYLEQHEELAKEHGYRPHKVRKASIVDRLLRKDTDYEEEEEYIWSRGV